MVVIFCGSALYYYFDHTCVLNSETQKNYPELFTKSDPKDGQVEYLDNNCFGSTVHQYYNIVYNIGPYILLIIFRFGPVE